MKSMLHINLLFLFHSQFQKAKIAFLHNSIHLQHNKRLKDVTRVGLCYILHGCIKGTKCMCMQLRVISILEYVNKNKDTRFNLKFTLSKCSLKYSYSLATFSHISQFAWPIALIMIMIKILGIDTDCKADQYTQQLSSIPENLASFHLLAVFIKLGLTNSQFLLFAQHIIQRIHHLTWPDRFQFKTELK